MKELFSLNVYFKQYAWRILAGLLFVLLSNIAGIYVPVLVRQGLDEAVLQASIAAGLGRSVIAASVFKTALWFGFFIVIAAIVKGIFMYLMRQYIVVVSREIEYDLKNDIYSHYQKLDTSFYRKNFTGDMMARIGEDVSNVRMYAGPAVMYFANILFVFITVIFQMVSVNPQLTLFVLLPLPLLSYSIYKVSSIINKRSTEIQTQLSTLTTFTQETFAGIRVLKSFGAEQHFQNAFEKEGTEYRRRTMRLAFVNSLFFPIMLLLIGLSNLIVLYLGGLEAAKGTFTTGNIAEFIIYLNMLIWPVASLGWTTALVQKAAASQKRINEFLNTEPVGETAGTHEFVFQSEIEFKDVEFTYENASTPALTDLNIKVQKGKIIGITGHTGSGKSTIVQLLMRLYQPISGTISVDAVPINTLKMDDFRHHVAYVPQDVFLFSETIEQNITFGREDGQTTLEELNAVVQMAALDADLLQLPDGLQTILGERGVTLSGGQKQRVSIARALLRNAELYVFDDCLSAVDAATETKIIGNLKAHLNGKTAIIVSHRVAPLSFADEIIVLDEGRIAEQGSPEKLLETKGLFAMLYEKQAFEKESVQAN